MKQCGAYRESINVGDLLCHVYVGYVRRGSELPNVGDSVKIHNFFNDTDWTGRVERRYSDNNEYDVRVIANEV